MRLVGASELQALGLDCIPVFGPIVTDHLSYPDRPMKRIRKTYRFGTLREAIEFFRQLHPCFIYEPDEDAPEGTLLGEAETVMVKGVCGFARRKDTYVTYCEQDLTPEEPPVPALEGFDDQNPCQTKDLGQDYVDPFGNGGLT